MTGLAIGPLMTTTACHAATPVDRVSLLDYLPSAEHGRLRDGTSVFDCTPALNRAVQDCAAVGKVLFLPGGIYTVRPTHQLRHDGERAFACLAAIKLVDGMRILGEATTIIRMVSGYSSDDRPCAMAMFGTDEQLSNVAFDGLTLDMNGDGNPISPARARGIFNRFPQAHIFVSGKPGGPAARIDNVRLDDVTFTGSNGVSCVVMAQTDNPTTRLGNGWQLNRCTFTENGMDTDDHSSVYGYADDVFVRDCRFANARPFTTTGVNTGYEVHGSNHVISGCTFVNALRGIWVANNYTAPVTATRIERNDFRTLYYGVDFFRDRAEAQDISDTVIAENRFEFDDVASTSILRPDFKAAVQIASDFSQHGVAIRNNVVNKIGTVIPSAFLVVTGGGLGDTRHDNITAAGNSGKGLTLGSFVRTSPRSGLGRLTIIDNDWENLTPAGAIAVAAGDAVEQTGTLQPIRSLTLGGGSVIDRRRVPRTMNAIFINGYVQRLNLSPIRTAGLTGKIYARGSGAQVTVNVGVKF
ncbi:hypothetical protein FPZ24_05190 [Sphingomonas panacisoli]|uniref:Right handed beta helix domain-containing protein n=1 Tax=Sphingomonas panacisoli TaxID=1813879 RepID=A0A5B8LG98_9SPHN|nr:hypothetical protein [Sphingomonas panacisoli]QDZ06949.1 hypothetical protein FPZ24_05190 [Sphingomonas panacisoli]